MCGRYSLVCIDDLGNRFRVHDPTLGFRSRFNVAPSQVMPVIVQRGEKPEIIPMQWGLISTSSQARAKGIRPINARAESLQEKPVFRSLLEKGRCLVPASGFFEWKNEGRRKIPFYIHPRDRPVFAFAGLYNRCEDDLGRVHLTYTIITTKASSSLVHVHDRMPVILDSRTEEPWLNGETPALSDPVGFLSRTVPGEMEIYPVSTRVNDPKNDDSSLIRPLRGIGM
jgi:putative SOS response-associated peptidase YedK